jgi:hypothetical protein
MGNMRLDLLVIECKVGNWLELVQPKGHQQDFVNMLMNFQVLLR